MATKVECQPFRAWGSVCDSVRSSKPGGFRGRPRFQGRRVARVSSRVPASAVVESVKHAASCSQTGAETTASRRALLAVSTAALTQLLLPTTFTTASAESPLVPFTDDNEGFSLSVPSGWAYGVGALDGNSSFSGSSGARKVVTWYREEDPATNVTVVLTTIGADYTSMGSFGTAYEFGSAMVGSMDRSYLLRAPAWARKGELIQVAKLLESKEISSRPQTYFIEYSITRPNGEERHLYSSATLRYNGRYNRLYTVTAQCGEGEVSAFGELLTQVVKSLDTKMIA